MNQSPKLRLQLSGKPVRHSALLATVCIGVLIFSAIALSVINHRAGHNILAAPPPVTQIVTTSPVVPNDIEGVRIMPPQTQTSPIQNGQSIRPVSPKISDSVVPETSPTIVGPSPEYITFWNALDTKAKQEFSQKNQKVTPEDIQKYRADFITSLGYWYDPTTQQVFSAPQSKIVISVTTLMCYLNGYVPDKPYIKPSCPSN